MTHADPDWLAMLREAVAATSQTDVAKLLDVSRTTVSLVLSGKYPGKTDRVAARVLKTFGQVQVHAYRAADHADGMRVLRQSPRPDQ
ncbi:MAG: hypothetical protein VB138_07455 [Burkholderia sp.]